MIYLIGGAPRVGKTQLTNEVLKRHPMHAISTDAVRYMLRRLTADPKFKEGLDKSQEKDVLATSIEQILKNQNDESQIVWPAVVELMRSYNEDGLDLLVEGVAVLPEQVSRLPFEAKAIFITNTSPSHQATILRQARANSHDWLAKYSDDEVAHYSQFFSLMSNYIESEAKAHDAMHISINDDSFEDDMQIAVTRLLA